MKKSTTKEFIEKARDAHGDIYDYSLAEYVGNKIKIKIICPKHGEFLQTPYVHLLHGCPYCSGNAKGTTKKFIEKVKKIHGDTYDYSLVDYKNNNTKIKIICSIHGVFEQQPKNHFQRKGCSKCAGNFKSTTEEFIERSKEIHGDAYDYSDVVYINAITKVKIICQEHGVFEQIPNDHLCGSGCPNCRSSKGESQIRKILKKENINFEEQKKFDECKHIRKLPFDFYLNDFNMCIEYDGMQHFESKDFFGGREGFERRQRNDKIKTEYCIKNKIRLERIKYDENIDSIMKNLLS